MDFFYLKAILGLAQIPFIFRKFDYVFQEELIVNKFL